MSSSLASRRDHRSAGHRHSDPTPTNAPPLTKPYQDNLSGWGFATPFLVFFLVFLLAHSLRLLHEPDGQVPDGCQ